MKALKENPVSPRVEKYMEQLEQVESSGEELEATLKDLLEAWKKIRGLVLAKRHLQNVREGIQFRPVLARQPLQSVIGASGSRPMSVGYRSGRSKRSIFEDLFHSLLRKLSRKRTQPNPATTTPGELTYANQRLTN